MLLPSHLAATDLTSLTSGFVVKKNDQFSLLFPLCDLSSTLATFPCFLKVPSRDKLASRAKIKRISCLSASANRFEYTQRNKRHHCLKEDIDALLSFYLFCVNSWLFNQYLYEPLLMEYLSGMLIFALRLDVEQMVEDLKTEWRSDSWLL